MSKRGIRLYIEDIFFAIEKIEIYTRGVAFHDFVEDTKTIDAVIRNLIVIGEAVRYLPDDVRAIDPKIPWREIASMRNKVVHEYFGIDENILWKTIQEDIPIFKKQIRELSARRDQ